MTQELNNSSDNTLDDIDKVFAISGIAISGLALLFYPAEEVADTSETDLGFISTVSKVVSVLGLIGTFWTIGLLYNKEVQVPPILKWVLIPLLVLDVLLVTLLIAMLALGTTGVATIGKLALKYVKPAVCSLGGAGLIVAMAVMPKDFLKMSFIGKTIHYLPAALGYAPMNKHPFYLLVVFVRTGGLVTSLASNIIDVAATDDTTNDTPPLES